MDVNRAKAAVVLMSFVGAPSSPFGNSITRQGSNAPDQLETKINKKIVPIKGIHSLCSSSPI